MARAATDSARLQVKRALSEVWNERLAPHLCCMEKGQGYGFSQGLVRRARCHIPDQGLLGKLLASPGLRIVPRLLWREPRCVCA